MSEARGTVFEEDPALAFDSDCIAFTSVCEYKQLFFLNFFPFTLYFCLHNKSELE
ncbi:hypothetical protein KIN20_002333 [Parelaphostrongylus tenuis]|uniref:Uncharacterized protein n=1 Tax=Parelaphostrongylus tenuis TaxID=148309 RepID=A0AAD5QGP0_PARTN|nr:hypothetical protein KIN20_002333 [Parelaphostrongylus tenuis]